MKKTISEISKKLGRKQSSTEEKKLVEIPDIVFRSYLMAMIPDAFPDGGNKMDANSSAVKNTRYINLSSLEKIKSVKGIEYFTALTYLNCGENTLTSLDLTHNPALTELHCYKNQLTSLDLTHNPALTELHCYKNQLTSLDLSKNCKLSKDRVSIDDKVRITWCEK